MVKPSISIAESSTMADLWPMRMINRGSEVWVELKHKTIGPFEDTWDAHKHLGILQCHILGLVDDET